MTGMHLGEVLCQSLLVLSKLHLKAYIRNGDQYAKLTEEQAKGSSVPAQPIHIKDINFFRPLRAETRPPELMVYVHGSCSLSSFFFIVTGRRLEMTRRRVLVSSVILVGESEE